MDRFFVFLYRFFAKRRWLLWTLMLVSFGVFVFFGIRVKYEEDISKLLPQTDASKQSGLAFGNIRVKDKIFIQIHSADGTPVDPQTLADCCDELVDSILVRDEGVGRVAGILYRMEDDMMMMALDYAMTNLPSLVDTSCYAAFDSLLTGDALARSVAQDREMVMSDETGSLTTMVGYDPAGLREVILPGDIAGSLGGFTVIGSHLFCKDSTVVMAFLSPDFNSMDSKAGTALVNMLEKEIRSFNGRHPEVEVLFHGSPVQSVFNSRQIKKDLALTMGLSLLLICFVIGLCFRNASTLPLLLSPVVYGAFFSLACVFWIKGGMSLMAVGIGALVLGVALSYCLHILTHSKYVDDPEQILRDQSTPVCLGCLTTVGAFMGLLFTQSDLLKDFGIFASLAMVGTTIFALVFLPHLFGKNQSRKNDRAFRMLDRINSYPVDRCGWLLILLTVICLVCFWTQGWVKFDSNLRNIGYNEPKVVESRELYEAKNNGGCASMYYASSADDLDTALEQEARILSVLDSLKTEGIVARHTNPLSLFIPESVQIQRIQAWESYWTPQREEQVSRSLGRAAAAEGLDPDLFSPFFSLVEAEYSPASLYDAGVLPEELLSNFIEQTADGKYMVFTSVLMPEELKKTVNDAVASCPGAVVIDPFYYTSDMVRVLNDDFNVILNISMIFVLIVLLLSFRSIALAVIAFVPMGLSWFVVKGVMGIFGLEFNLINIIIATFIFGIGVDYSIFVMKGLLARASGKDDRLLTEHKTAILFSAFVLIVVVTSLLFAVHPAIKSIGVSTLVGMSATILITYALQPFLFRQLMRIRYYSRRFGGGKPTDTLPQDGKSENDGSR
ncbi:MAG: MMPL family transporter [Candidatus Cryptobacteroides sp.]